MTTTTETTAVEWDDLPLFLDVDDLQRVLRCGRDAARRFCRDHEGTVAWRVGQAWRVNRHALQHLGHIPGEATA